MKRFGWIILLWAGSVFGVDPTIQVKVNPQAIGTNEVAEVLVSVTGESLQHPPVLSAEPDGFDIAFAGSSSQTQISIINGKQQLKTLYSYIYQIIPKRSGILSIPSFIATTKKGKEIYSPPSSVDVQNTDSINLRQHRFRAFDPFAPFADDPGQAFLQWRISKSRVVQNTGLIADLYLFTDNERFLNNLSHLRSVERLRFDGGVVHEVPLPEEKNIINEHFGGDPFSGILLKRFILFPLEAGTLNVQSPILYNNNGPFSAQIYGNPIQIHSMPVTKKLSYIGNELEIQNELSAEDTAVSEEIAMTVIIEGDGNTDYFSNPYLNMKIDGLFISEPESTVEAGIDEKTGDIFMRKILKYTLIARKAGDFTIPSIELEYYDFNGNKHKTISEPLYFSARPSRSTSGSKAQFPNLPAKNHEIAYYPGWRFIIPSALMSIFLVLGGFLRDKRRQKLKIDPGFARLTQSKKRLQNTLKDASEALEKKQFKDAARLLKHGLTTFCTDKFGLPQTASQKDILYTLTKKNLNPEALKQFQKLIGELEFCAFGAEPNDKQIQSYFLQTENLLAQIEKLKSR